MSVAVLTADTSAKVVAPRADRKLASTGGDQAEDFRNLVKNDAAREASESRKAKAGDDRDGAAEAGNDGNHRTWRRYDSIFEARAGNIGEDADKADANETAEEKTEENENGTAGIANALTAIADSAKGTGTVSGQAKEAAGQSGVAPANMDAEGAALSTAAKAVEASASAKSATPGVLPGEAAAAGGNKPEALQQAPLQIARPANADTAQNGNQSATAEIALQKAEADSDTFADGDGGRREGQGREQSSPAQQQAANGNRIAGVSVVSQQVAPAMPASPAGLSNTGAAFVESLAGDIAASGRSEAAANTSLAQPNARPGAITTLRIQLQPAELGMVTARLTGTEAQLSIEITVDNAEARHRLSTDSDAIVTALRGLGIDVDRISVQQSQANTGPTPNGRGNEFAQSGENGGDRQNRDAGQGSGREQGGNTRSNQGNAPSDAAGGGLYI